MVFPVHCDRKLSEFYSSSYNSTWNVCIKVILKTAQTFQFLLLLYLILHVLKDFYFH